jgi:hypothetical protein
MDLLTAIALAPSQPDCYVLVYCAAFTDGPKNRGTYYCRLDCFERFGISTFVTDIEECEFVLVSGAENFYCTCGGPKLHRLDQPHPR